MESYFNSRREKIVVLITNKIAKYFGYSNYIEDKTKIVNFVHKFFVFVFRIPQFVYYKISTGNISDYKSLLSFIIKRINR